MKKTLGIVCIAAIGLISCSEPKNTDSTDAISATVETEDLAEPDVAQLLNFDEVATDFHQLAEQTTKDMLAQCALMQADVQSFIGSPSDESQLAAQTSFLPCYQGWVKAALFFQLPFDLSNQKPFKNLVELIDTRPFLPGYIDGIPEYPFSGLIHELDLPVTASNLRGQHRLMDEESASVGFPVIEFFLWKMPAQEFWIADQVGDDKTIVDRRKEYLGIATTLLIEELTQAVIRWQPNNRFNELPERAKMSYVLKSLQRLTMIELLQDKFEEETLIEPEWHHSSMISGQGRSYITAQLDSVIRFAGNPDSAFNLWLSKVLELPFESGLLAAELLNTQAAFESLPENYPFDSEADENWMKARQSIAQTSLYFSQISEHFQVTIATD